MRACRAPMLVGVVSACFVVTRSASSLRHQWGSGGRFGVFDSRCIGMFEETRIDAEREVKAFVVETMG